jgi:hypothetical protein
LYSEPLDKLKGSPDLSGFVLFLASGCNHSDRHDKDIASGLSLFSNSSTMASCSFLFVTRHEQTGSLSRASAQPQRSLSRRCNTHSGQRASRYGEQRAMSGSFGNNPFF